MKKPNSCGFYLIIEIEAGLRSPLHNPASTHGHLSTTELKLYLVAIPSIAELVGVQS